LTELDDQETKLPTYWKTKFSKICFGMEIGHQINFIEIRKVADYLYSLISNGKYQQTSLGRVRWKMLIGVKASLQDNCNNEGFNVSPKARIGKETVHRNEDYKHKLLSWNNMEI